jgi:hypothetical protein
VFLRAVEQFAELERELQPCAQGIVYGFVTVAFGFYTCCEVLVAGIDVSRRALRRGDVYPWGDRSKANADDAAR